MVNKADSKEPESLEEIAVGVRDIWRIPQADALALVESRLGPPDAWPSPLIAYRMGSDFQSSWKVELGQWLKVAEDYGFLDRVLHDIRTQAQRPSKSATVHANDERHLKLHQHVAVARIVHYLTALGWDFEAYEPETGGAVDIDVSLRAPGGVIVEMQVKAPDQPGYVVDGRIVDGEHDQRVLAAVGKAARQLRQAPTKPAVIVICANRNWPLCWELRPLVKYLIGSTHQVDEELFLPKGRRGGFFSADWSHVSGVLVLDLVRGIERSVYSSVVLTNPNAACPVSPDWFPRSRVVVLDDGVFRWVRGEPGKAHTLPDGTVLVDEIPESAFDGLCEKWAREGRT